VSKIYHFKAHIRGVYAKLLAGLFVYFCMTSYNSTAVCCCG